MTAAPVLREMASRLRRERCWPVRVDVDEMAEPETCCGFGGTFSIKFGEISTRLADDKCQHIANSGVDAVVLGDLGCMLNIEGRMRRRGDMKTRVLHFAEVLAGQSPEA
jgi:L-lactate dehydrogenase complex protein LldE